MIASPLSAQPTSPESMGMPLDEAYAYYMSLLFAKDRKLALEAIDQIAEKLAADFIAGIKAMEQASGLERPGPQARLQWYRQKPEELWAEQEAKFPRRYDKDQADYDKLQEWALDGRFGPQEQAIEYALIVREVEEGMGMVA